MLEDFYGYFISCFGAIPIRQCRHLGKKRDCDTCVYFLNVF